MKRLECLDGLRGVLAMYVLLGHMAPFAALPAWLQNVVSHGGAAVDVFFMLSGLVITQALLPADGRTRRFLIVRAARIFPVFLPVFAIAVAVAPLPCGFEIMPWVGPDNAARTICVMAWPHRWLPEIAAHLTMTHGLFPDGILPDVWVSFLGSAWSLSTEWQFYGVALLLAAWPLSPRQPDEPRPPRRLAVAALCWTLLGLATAGTVWRLLGPDAWQFSRAFLLNKAHFFALGVASVGLVRAEPGAPGRYACVLAITLTICATQAGLGKLLPPVVWTLCLLAQMRPDAAGFRTLAALLRSRVGLYLGAISYCLYLVNEPIHKILGLILGPLAAGNGWLFTMLWTPAAIGLPVLISGWLHRHLEAPALRWGRAVASNTAKPSVQAGKPGL